MRKSKKTHSMAGTKTFLKRTTSIVLSIMLLASLFSINFSVSAAEVETTADTSAETTAETKAPESVKPTEAKAEGSEKATKATEEKKEETTPAKKNKVKSGADAKVKTGATSGSCGTNATWSYNTSTKVLTISGSGRMKDYDDDDPQYCEDYQDEIKSIVIGSGITYLGNYAFTYCSVATSVTIPNTVTTIGYSAFIGCSSLSTINIPSSVDNIEARAFYCCTGLTAINIPNSVTTIGEYAFGSLASNSALSKVKTISIGDHVTSIGNYAFNWCTAVTSLTIPDSVTTIGQNAFQNCKALTNVSIGSGIASIGNAAFSSCSKISTATYNGTQSEWNNVTVGNSNTYLTSMLTFQEDVSNITWEIQNENTLVIIGSGEMDDYELLNNYSSSSSSPWRNHSTSVTSIVIEEGITTIGTYAFSAFSNVTSVSIPSTLTEIKEEAFHGCKALSSLTLPTNKTLSESVTIDKTAFNVAGRYGIDCNFDANGTCGENINWEITGSSLYITGTGAMYNYSLTEEGINNSNNTRNVYEDSSLFTKLFRPRITSVTIGSGITTIGTCAFNSLNNLSNVSLPDGLTTILGYAFAGSINVKNESLTNISIPNSVTTISHGAFENTGLTSLNIPNNVTELSRRLVSGCEHLRSITIGEGVTNIDMYPFENCPNLNTIYFNAINCQSAHYPGGTRDGQGNFHWYVPFYKANNLTTAVIGSKVKTIPDYMFYDCQNLSTITIPDGVTRIGIAAFYNCPNLTVQLPDTIDTVERSAFMSNNRIVAPTESYVYNLLTTEGYTTYRSNSTEVIGIVSNQNQFNLFSNSISSTGKGNKISTGKKVSITKTGDDVDEVAEELIAPTDDISTETTGTYLCYLVNDVSINNNLIFNNDKSVTLHLNEFSIDNNGNIVNGEAHTLSGSSSKGLIEVPGSLTIITPGEGQGGITNTGKVFDVKDGGSLTIENGVYSEDVSEYIADNKVMGKTGNRYTVLNSTTEDLTPENDNHTFILNDIEAYAREQLLGVQIRPETETVSQAMRFVSVVRSDVLRGAEDYGFVLAKGRNVENMRTNKANILADSDKCVKISAKGTENSLAGTAYSSKNLEEGKYKYLTAAITNIDDDSSAVGARLYIKRADGTYVYADYTCVSTMGELKALAA